MKLRTHDVTLRGDRVVLRPMTEDDWQILLPWNNDPEVLYFGEGDDVSSRDMEDMQQIYRSVSQNAICFIAEVNTTPIGECWLQHMNLERILRRYPGLDCRRIDLMIGEKTLWGKGLGTEIIHLLTEYAFSQEKADLVFACDIADYNPRSLRAFQRVGYQIDAMVAQPPGSKAEHCYDVFLRRECFPV